MLRTWFDEHVIGRRRDQDPDATNEDTGAESAVSPWATGDVPVADDRPEIDWAVGALRRDQREAESDRDEPPRRPAASIGIGVAAVVAVGAVAVFVWPRSDDDAAPVDDDPATAETVLDELPELDDGLDDGLGNERPDTPGNGELLDDARDDDIDDAGSGDGDELLDDPDLRPGGLGSVIEVPSALGELTAATEVVLTTADAIVTLSLPSGRVRTVEIGRDTSFGFGGPPPVVSPDGAVIPGGDGSLLLIPRVGGAITVDAAELGGNGIFAQGWLTDDDGSTAFQVTAFGSSSPTEYLVRLDGSVREVSDPSLDVFSSFEYVRSPNERLVNDAGGVYRLLVDGSAERIADGRGFSSNGDSLLLRECDAALTCQLLVADLVTGERRIVDPTLIDGFDPFSLDLAPDGTALSIQVDSGSSERLIVDFDEGIVARAPSFALFALGSSWVGDSSGVIQPSVTGRGLTFVDRATGETSDFGDELGAVGSVTVRYPDSELPLETGPISTVKVGFDDPLSASTGIELVAVGRLGSAVHLDLDAGLASAWSAPALPGQRAPGLFAAGDTVIAVSSGGDGYRTDFGQVTPFESSPSSGPIPPAPRFAGSTPGTVWAPAVDDPTKYLLYPLDGTPETPVDTATIDVDGATILGADGLGGLVAEVGGDVFALSPQGATRITSGDLLALNQFTALVRECDEKLVCRVLLVGRGSGVSLDVAGSDGEVAVAAVSDLAVAGVDEDRGVPVADTMSPSGSLLVLPQRTGTSTDGVELWAVHDVTTGTVTSIPKPADGQPLIWSEVGDTLVFLSDGDLHVYERATGAVTTLRGIGELRAITRVDPDFDAE